MALANLIKNVDPPIELTQAEYDALSTAQKNDGTVYFITDGNGGFPTASTVPAEDTSGGNSNVQDELDKKVQWDDVTASFTTTQSGIAVADASALKIIADNYATVSNLQNGTTVVRTAQYLTAPTSGGYNTDSYGNFIHNNNNTTNFWSLKNNDSSRDVFRVYFETGRVLMDGRQIVRTAGQTVSLTSYPCSAWITASQKNVYISIPFYTGTSVSSVSVTDFSCIMRHVEGGYVYLCYGSNNATYEQLGTGKTSIWANNRSVRTNGVQSIGVTNHTNSLMIRVSLINTLRKNAGTDVVLNNTPISLDFDATLVLA